MNIKNVFDLGVSFRLKIIVLIKFSILILILRVLRAYIDIDSIKKINENLLIRLNLRI